MIRSRTLVPSSSEEFYSYIEAGVLDLVKLVVESGFEPYSSCEGHADIGETETLQHRSVSVLFYNKISSNLVCNIAKKYGIMYSFCTVPENHIYMCNNQTENIDVITFVVCSYYDEDGSKSEKVEVFKNFWSNFTSKYRQLFNK